MGKAERKARRDARKQRRADRKAKRKGQYGSPVFSAPSGGGTPSGNVSASISSGGGGKATKTIGGKATKTLGGGGSSRRGGGSSRSKFSGKKDEIKNTVETFKTLNPIKDKNKNPLNFYEDYEGVYKRKFDRVNFQEDKKTNGIEEVDYGNNKYKVFNPEKKLSDPATTKGFWLGMGKTTMDLNVQRGLMTDEERFGRLKFNDLLGDFSPVTTKIGHTTYGDILGQQEIINDKTKGKYKKDVQELYKETAGKRIEWERQQAQKNINAGADYNTTVKNFENTAKRFNTNFENTKEFKELTNQANIKLGSNQKVFPELYTTKEIKTKLDYIPGIYTGKIAVKELREFSKEFQGNYQTPHPTGGKWDYSSAYKHGRRGLMYAGLTVADVMATKGLITGGYKLVGRELNLALEKNILKQQSKNLFGLGQAEMKGLSFASEKEVVYKGYQNFGNFKRVTIVDGSFETPSKIVTSKLKGDAYTFGIIKPQLGESKIAKALTKVGEKTGLIKDRAYLGVERFSINTGQYSSKTPLKLYDLNIYKNEGVGVFTSESRMSAIAKKGTQEDIVNNLLKESKNIKPHFTTETYESNYVKDLFKKNIGFTKGTQSSTMNFIVKDIPQLNIIKSKKFKIIETPEIIKAPKPIKPKKPQRSIFQEVTQNIKQPEIKPFNDIKINSFEITPQSKGSNKLIQISKPQSKETNQLTNFLEKNIGKVNEYKPINKIPTSFNTNKFLVGKSISVGASSLINVKTQTTLNLVTPKVQNLFQTKQLQKLTTQNSFQQSFSQPNFTPNFSTPTPTPKIPIPKIPIFPGIPKPNLRIGKKSGGGSMFSDRFYKYAPSMTAMVYGLKGKKTKGVKLKSGREVYTGFEVRKIIG